MLPRTESVCAAVVCKQESHHVFATSMSESEGSLLVGSVKSNIGHLEMAAGMAGLMKAILGVCEESVPPNVGLEKLNPRVEESIASHDFSVELPTIVSALRETSGKEESELLVAGVSSFGYSGTITHAVVRQAPEMCRRRDMIGAGPSSSVFPNRVKLPWMMPPHPLLQQAERLGIGSRGVEYVTVFHEKLMSLYNGHVIGGRCLFPGAGFVEIGLAAGVRMLQGGSANSVIELLDVSFISPLDIEDGCMLISEHSFGRGMEFFLEDTKNDAEGDAMPMARIGEIKAGSAGSSSIEGASHEVLSSWKDSHKQKVEGIRERYDELVEQGFHRGAFQSIESVWLSDDSKSALGQICLPESWEHEHDAFYHAHPAVLDGAFQMATVFFMSATETWVPARINSFMMHRAGKLHGQRKIWARVELEHDGPKMKLCNIDLLDEDEGVIISAEGFRYAKLLDSVTTTSDIEKDPRMYTTSWIEAECPSQDDADGELGSFPADVCIVNLPGCLALGMSMAEEDKVNVSTMTLSDLESLVDPNGVAEVVLVPLVDIESTDASSTGVLEACVSLMQIMTKKLQDATDGVSRRICFWTRNAEGPHFQQACDDTSESDRPRSGDYDEMLCSLVGGNVWGMVRSAAVEMDSRVLSMVCIDTDDAVGAEEAWRQVWQELGTTTNVN